MSSNLGELPLKYSDSLLDKTAIKELFKHDKTIENMDNSYDLQLSFNF